MRTPDASTQASGTRISIKSSREPPFFYPVLKLLLARKYLILGPFNLQIQPGAQLSDNERASIAMQADVANSDLKKLEVPIEGRFFKPIPYEELCTVVKKVQDLLSGALKDNVWHVGSSSLKGMSGMLGTDLVAVAPVWPVPQQMIDHLDAVGFRNGGNSPHCQEHGLWFFFRDDFSVVIGDEVVGGVGCVLHLVESKEQLIDFVAFREYCSDKSQDGFSRYKLLKEEIASLDGQSKVGYKSTKAKRIGEIFKDALAYWNSRQLQLEQLKRIPSL